MEWSRDNDHNGDRRERRKYAIFSAWLALHLQYLQSLILFFMLLIILYWSMGHRDDGSIRALYSNIRWQTAWHFQSVNHPLKVVQWQKRALWWFYAEYTYTFCDFPVISLCPCIASWFNQNSLFALFWMYNCFSSCVFPWQKTKSKKKLK